MAWLISFVSQVIADVDSGIPDFPRFAWWTITYELFCLLGVALILALDAIPRYQIALVGFLTAGLVFTCSAANTFVYSPKAAMEAAGAGHILLSIIQILWIFYFGSTTDAGSHTYVDSFALHKDTKGASARPLSPPYARSHHTSSTHTAPQMYTSAQLSGFETSSPVTEYRQSSTTPQQQQVHMGQHQDEVGQPTEYPYRAKAIYSYDANPEDANEISFTKHEILEVSDVSGRWWQARKQNGETGIAPSNYLILL
jgi:SHO1 osmosensor